MNIEIKELNDNRFIGFGIFEIASFPLIEGSGKEIEAELEQSYNMFLHVTREFYKLGGDSNTVAELLWVAEKQKSRHSVQE